MVRINILTLFPEMFSALNCSVIKKALEKKLFEINVVDIRDFSNDVHKKCDDYPYGGGAGMVMMAQPIVDAFKSLNLTSPKVIFTSPRGKLFNQSMAKEFAKNEDIVILCGHYEGVDQRVIEILGAEEISIGDYILTGGELPAMVIIDALARNIEGVINNQSLEEESFSTGLLEYPQFTRPEIFENKAVPNVLLSGNHKDIQSWRFDKALEITKRNRKDLFVQYCKNNYRLIDAKSKDFERLVSYKKNNVFDYANDANDKEVKKIKENIKSYKIIAIKDKKIGFVCIKKIDDGILLDEMYIDEDYRNNKIGTDIIENLVKENKIVYLWVCKNNLKAIKLYKNLGFEIVEENSSKYKMKYTRKDKK